MFVEQKVACVFDWDKTLSPHYMQRPLFEHYNVSEKEFWAYAHERAKRNTQTLGSRCFVEHEYLNAMLDYVRLGKFPGLTNAKFSELGHKIELYPGVVELFEHLRAKQVEIYIVTSGIRSILKDIPIVTAHVTGLYGADFADHAVPTFAHIASIARSLLPGDKIRILNEISKGCGVHEFDGCVALPEKERRVPFSQMIYVGDGVTDIYAFDTVRSHGGFAMGVYHPSEPKQFEQIEMIRQDGWLDFVGTADFRLNASTGNWIQRKTDQMLNDLVTKREKDTENRLEELRKHAPDYIHAWSKK